MDHFETPPRNPDDGRFAALAEPVTSMPTASAIKAATTNIIAATNTFGRYPSTSSFRKSVTLVKPSTSTVAVRNTTMTNHFTSAPINTPTSNLIPALSIGSSTPRDCRALSIFSERRICSTTFPKACAITQPTTKITTDATNRGANEATPVHNSLKERINASPQVSIYINSSLFGLPFN